MKDRLVALTEQAMDGDFDDLRRILEAAGGHWSTDKDGRNPRCACAHGMMIGIPVGQDPVATYVQVCFAVIGPLWTTIPDCLEGMRAIRERWSARAKASKATT